MRQKFLLGICIAGLAWAYLLGLHVDVMDVDAAQYASISLEMLHNKSFLEVKHWNQDYLDKPPLLFWLSSLSFLIFGASNWSYKLPSLLFSLLGFYSTYRFATIYYKERTARYAALILASCQAMFLINNDVRTDTILTGSVIFSVWQIAAYIEFNRWRNLIFGGIGVGLAMLAKGPIGLAVPVLAFGGSWMFRKEWKNFFRWHWLAGFIIVGIMLVPMCIGLYRQFGVEGLKFYFWTQSFGRITGENRWQNEAGPFFLLSNFLWAFLPWTLIFIGGFVRTIINLIHSGRQGQPELISLSGFLLPFIALSFSHYQLPHYIFVVFPFAAVLTGKFLVDIQNNGSAVSRTYSILQPVFVLALWMSIFMIAFYIFPHPALWLILILLLLAALTIYVSALHKDRFLIPSVITMIAGNILLNAHFYPDLLQYQSSKQLAESINSGEIPYQKFYNYKTNSHALDFYIGKVAQEIYSEDFLPGIQGDSVWVYATAEGMQEISRLDLNYTKADSFNYIKITQIPVGFLNPKTRDLYLKKAYLLLF